MKYISGTLIALTVLLGVATLIGINTQIAAGSTLKENEQKLSALESNYQELKSQYLKNLLAHIEPQATAAGFVSITSPRYITSDTAVSFVSGRVR